MIKLGGEEKAFPTHRPPPWPALSLHQDGLRVSQIEASDMGRAHRDAIFTSWDLGEVMHLLHFGLYLLRDTE